LLALTDPSTLSAMLNSRRQIVAAEAVVVEKTGAVLVSAVTA